MKQKSSNRRSGGVDLGVVPFVEPEDPEAFRQFDATFASFDRPILKAVTFAAFAQRLEISDLIGNRSGFLSCLM